MSLRKLSLVLKQPLFWAGAIFMACFFFFLSGVALGWNDAIGGRHDFRQAQTAISCFYMLSQPFALAYETPVLGPPWALPMEFPLYQWIVVSFVRLFGMHLDQAGRLVSVLSFLLTLSLAYILLGVLRVARTHRLLFLSLFLVSPFYIFWARAFMIETTAVCLSVASLTFAALYAPRRSWSFIILASICGVLGALVKVTTFVVFLFPITFFLSKDLLRRPFLRPRWPTIRPWLVNLILTAGLPLVAAIGWARFADQIKEQNVLGHFLTSSNLTGWNFGTLEQRLSITTWQTLVSRAPMVVTPSLLFWIACLLVLVLTRRRWKEAGSCLFLCLAAPLLFTNLHQVHDYYMCANGIFLLGAVGFCAVAVLESPRPLVQKAGWGGVLLALVLAGSEYRSVYAPLQMESHRAVANYVKKFLAKTKPDSVTIYLGFDWSSLWPYYGKRRALMLPDWREIDDALVRRALVQLQRYEIGAVIATGKSNYPLDSLIANMKALGLDTTNVCITNRLTGPIDCTP